MADLEDKQSMIAIEISDYVSNDADLAVNSSFENQVMDETTDTANEIVAVTQDNDATALTLADDQSCERTGNDDQSNSGDVADTIKVKSQRRKRTGMRELVASADTETPLKRRRVQHNYRRLSSAGYVDDYDGRERFSAKQTTASLGNKLSKSTNVDSPAVPSSGHLVSRTTRLQSELSTKYVNVRGLSVFVKVYFIFKNICSRDKTAANGRGKVINWLIFLSAKSRLD